MSRPVPSVALSYQYTFDTPPFDCTDPCLQILCKLDQTILTMTDSTVKVLKIGGMLYRELLKKTIFTVLNIAK